MEPGVLVEEEDMDVTGEVVTAPAAVAAAMEALVETVALDVLLVVEAVADTLEREAMAKAILLALLKMEREEVGAGELRNAAHIVPVELAAPEYVLLCLRWTIRGDCNGNKLHHLSK